MSRHSVYCAMTFLVILITGCGSRAPAKPRPSAHRGPPAEAIVFDRAASDALDARIEIAYVSAHGGAVVVVAGAGRTGMVAAEPRWSPGGSRIAFVMSPRGYLTRYAGDGDIYVMRADGTGLRRLTRGLDSSSPAWSPGGSQIAFVKNQGQELAIVRADGSGQRIVASSQGYYESPTWSPDGETLAYQASPDHNIDVSAIFTLDLGAAHDRQLTPAAAAAGSPAWSPDGSRIAYSAGGQLWVMRLHASRAGASASRTRRLTRCRAPCVSDLAPAWSPGGTDVVFVQQESGGAARRIYVVDVASGHERRLTPVVRWAGSPDWRSG